MKRIGTTVLVMSAVALAACGSSAESDGSAAYLPPSNASESPGAGGYAASSSSSGGPSPGASGEKSGGAASSANGSGSQAQAGILTAGVWDDNLNFSFFQQYLQGTEQSLAGVPTFSAAEREAAHQRFSQRAPSGELDIAFLLDTTGSMGDELSYLQGEIAGISDAIKAKFPQTMPRYGLVLYKDQGQGDPYVTRVFDFDGLEGFRSNLAAQTVGGGGDYEEEVAAGLDAVTKLSWRSGSVARLTFWVADAPHHASEAASVKTSIQTASQKDVHVYPVAASGSDPRTELTMRTAAQMTGGRYVFLTDDSGIGNAHAEPHIPCYQVTKFDRAIVRMVESEMTGTHVEPEPSEVIRTVGDPQDGQCVTQSAGTVTLY